MKTKRILFIGFLSGLMCLVSCDDTIDRVGMGIQPDEDKIYTFGDSLLVSGTTVKDPALYAKTMNGLLGNFYDPAYGELKAGYICQFYPEQGFGSKERIDSIDAFTGGKVDSIQLNILYASYVGDSLSPMEVTVYPVRKTTPLTENYYTPLNPADYCDLNTPLGKKTYTARDLNISDSLNLANITNGNYKVVSVKLSRELGQSFYDEYKACLNDPDRQTFKTPEALANFLPGLYIQSTLGSGCLLEVEKTSIFIYSSWTRQVEDTTQANNLRTDTLTGAAVLNVTKEIIQLNEYVGSHDEQLWEVSDAERMYLKTPAGIFAQISIPMNEIKQKIGNRKFSNVRLSIEADPPSEWQYNWVFPGTTAASKASMSQSKLLLIEPDSIRTFFEQQKTADGNTSFFTTFDTSAYAYTFSNIANVIQYAIDANIDPLVLRLVPVEVAYYTSSSSYSYTSTTVDYASSHYLFPAAVTLKKDNLKIYLLAADLSR
ncbi:MAG: DUF4270 domain-containing protein [Dysgonamonadaceae bacterium]|jgi:hypothetical protein|nr:DUF4270 domain-containing protein [Dysgonamonadaceae bacterium]